jgi:signal-transduction protein with cAMP-binding, CBS, and nucleotidyltransferase domain
MVVTCGETRVHRIRLIGGLHTFFIVFVVLLNPHLFGGNHMRPIRELLEKQDGAVWSLSPNDSVYQALEMLADCNVGALMVMEGEALVGVFSERDYTRKIALTGRSSKDTSVRDIMTAQVVSVSPQTSTDDCMALMSQRKIRHVPVVDGTKVLGMVSIRDLLDDIIKDREQTITQLQNYIAS